MVRASLRNVKRLVVKVGSALLTADGRGLNPDFIQQLSTQIAEVKAQGIDVVLVSSGAIVAGVADLGWPKRPDKVNQQQAAAAVGQASLIRQYEDAFATHNLKIAQVLLTHSDIADRERYLNARSALTTLIKLDLIAIVNENDTVATEEICFGDNDSLGALVCNLIDADLLVILTDQQGLYSADPRQDANAELVAEANAEDESLMSMAASGTSLGRGGMITKLSAARIAARSGAATLIAHGQQAGVLKSILAGDEVGTLLTPSQRLSSKKQWMANQMKIGGSLQLDNGAVTVLKSAGKSLLPVGVIAVNGRFKKGDLVSLLDPDGSEIGRGLSNYSAEEAALVKGMSSVALKKEFGDMAAEELVHRDHMVLY
ncbi:MAG: glutamate 5-kinase [Pseudomonadota bacterium]